MVKDQGQSWTKLLSPACWREVGSPEPRYSVACLLALSLEQGEDQGRCGGGTDHCPRFLPPQEGMFWESVVPPSLDQQHAQASIPQGGAFCVFLPNPLVPWCQQPHTSPPAWGLRNGAPALVWGAATCRPDLSVSPAAIECLSPGPTSQTHSQCPARASNHLPVTSGSLTCHLPLPRLCVLPLLAPHCFRGRFPIPFPVRPLLQAPLTWPCTISLASKKGPYSNQGPQCHGPRQHCPH